MRYCNINIDFEEEHMVQIATAALSLLKENLSPDEFEEFLEENDISDSQREFFGLEENGDDDYEDDDDYGWQDDSDRGCKDCPPDECTGHCMSCYYRPV